MPDIGVISSTIVAGVLLGGILALTALGLAFVGCLLATSATPLGVTFWTEIPRSLARIRQLGIEEWAPPRVTNPLLIPFWLIAAALVGLVVARARALSRDMTARRRGSLTVCAAALSVLPLAVTAERNVPPFLLLAVPAIAALMVSTALRTPLPK